MMDIELDENEFDYINDMEFDDLDMYIIEQFVVNGISFLQII